MRVKNRLRQLENRVLGEAMGWHARKPFALSEWIHHAEGHAIEQLRRIDSACAALLEERKRVKGRTMSEEGPKTVITVPCIVGGGGGNPFIVEHRKVDPMGEWVRSTRFQELVSDMEIMYDSLCKESAARIAADDLLGRLRNVLATSSPDDLPITNYERDELLAAIDAIVPVATP
jgi:hypothetical protein